MDENTIGTKLIEVESVEQVSPANKKQTRTYLGLTGNKLGYLLTFGCGVMKPGTTRRANGLSEKVSEDCLRLLHDKDLQFDGADRSP
jgi:hypothetical protein